MNEKTDAGDGCVSHSRAAKVLNACTRTARKYYCSIFALPGSAGGVASGQRSSLISVERAQLLVTDCVWLAVAQPAKSGDIGNQSKAAFVVARSNFGNVHRHRAYCL
jgi:hypothetical protein